MLRLRVEGGRRLVEDEHEWTITHEAASERELLPLTEADLDTFRPGWTKLGIEAGGESSDHVIGAGATDGRCNGRCTFVAWHVAEADAVQRAELEAEEILERAGHSLAPGVRGDARERRIVDQNLTGHRFIHARQQLDHGALPGPVLADDCDDRTRGQLE